MKSLYPIVLLLISLAMPSMAAPASLPVLKGIGGDFVLDSTIKPKTALSDMSNKVVLLTFGYTNCSDVCPVTLGFLNRTLKKLGDLAAQTQVLFVSLDPEYDTLEHMEHYLAFFNPDFIGLTGPRDTLDAITKQYNIRYSKTSNLQVSTEYRKLQIPKQAQRQSDNSSLYSHSTSIYLIDFQMRVRAIFDTTSSTTKIAEATRQLIEE